MMSTMSNSQQPRSSPHPVHCIMCCHKKKFMKREGWRRQRLLFPIRCKKISIVPLLLLLLVQFATAQNNGDVVPTSSPAPISADISTSNMPSTEPVLGETTSQPSMGLDVTASPIDLKPPPTTMPTFSPTTSPQPSYQPTTTTTRPTSSEAPSSSPTQTAKPTQSPLPTNVPSSSPLPTMSPSISPTLALVTAQRFNVRMIFDGLPYYIPNITLVPNTNSTANDTWTNITSEHVITYWRRQNYTDFNISSVETVIENQFIEPTDIVTDPPRITRVIYRQQIKYASWGVDSPLWELNEDMLFTWPFRASQQNYVDLLRQAFATPQRIFMLNVTLTATPLPTMPPNMAPSASPGQPDNGRLATGAVVAAALCSIAAFAIIVGFIIWYITRRKPDIVLDEEFVEHGWQDNDMVIMAPKSEDPRVIVPGDENDAGVLHTMEGERLSEENPYSSDEGEDVRYNRQGSLHVGIPVEGEMNSDSMEDDDDDSYYYPQADVLTESVREAHRPSMTGFAMTIQELEE